MRYRVSCGVYPPSGKDLMFHNMIKEAMGIMCEVLEGPESRATRIAKFDEANKGMIIKEFWINVSDKVKDAEKELMPHIWGKKS